MVALSLQPHSGATDLKQSYGSVATDYTGCLRAWKGKSLVGTRKLNGIAIPAPASPKPTVNEGEVKEPTLAELQAAIVAVERAASELHEKLRDRVRVLEKLADGLAAQLEYHQSHHGDYTVGNHQHLQVWREIAAQSGGIGRVTPATVGKTMGIVP